MSVTPMHHYSLTNLPTIYDEEALTVLELVARLSGKFNELITDHNRLEEAIKNLYGEEMARMVGEWLEKHPEITTTLQDGEITVEKLHETLKLKTVKDYVTPYMFGAVGDGSADDTLAVQQAMASGDRVYFDGVFRITSPLKLRSFTELYGTKGAILYTPNDISIFEGGDQEVHGCYIHDLQFKNGHASPTHYQLDLQNANMVRIFNCRIDTESKDLNAVGGIKVWRTLDGMFSPLIMCCDLRNSSIWCDVTDGYILNTNVWANYRQFAVHLSRSSWQIANCQFVGGKMGALWVEDTERGYNVELIRVSNCFFDGSYANLQTGVGLRAKNMMTSAFTSNTFWMQKEEGVILENCGYTTITGNVFDCNGINNFKEDAVYNRDEPFYEIEIKGTAIFLNITGNTFRSMSYHIPCGCINTEHTSDTITGNVIAGNTASTFGFYRNPAFNIKDTFTHNANIYANVANPAPDNVLSGNLKVTGRLDVNRGHRYAFTWGLDDLNGSTSILGVNTSKLGTYIMPDAVNVRKIACNINTPLTEGRIDVKLRVNGKTREESTLSFTPDMTNGWVTSKTFARGEMSLYALETLGILGVANGVGDVKNIQVTVEVEN